MMPYSKRGCNGAVECAITKRPLIGPRLRGSRDEQMVWRNPSATVIPAVYTPEPVFAWFQSVRPDSDTGEKRLWEDPITKAPVDREAELVPGGLIHHVAQQRSSYVVKADPKQLTRPFSVSHQQRTRDVLEPRSDDWLKNFKRVPGIGRKCLQFDLFFANGKALHFHFDPEANLDTGGFFLLLADRRSRKPCIRMVPIENVEGYLRAVERTVRDRLKDCKKLVLTLQTAPEATIRDLLDRLDAQLSVMNFRALDHGPVIDLAARIDHAAPVQLPIFNHGAFADELAEDLQQYAARNVVRFRL